MTTQTLQTLLALNNIQSLLAKIAQTAIPAAASDPDPYALPAIQTALAACSPSLATAATVVSTSITAATTAAAPQTTNTTAAAQTAAKTN